MTENRGTRYTPPVELEKQVAGAFLVDLIDARSQVIAREEVASLCGLVLRRLQAYPSGNFASSGLTIEARAAAADLLNGIFGELLRDFSSDTGEPGA